MQIPLINEHLFCKYFVRVSVGNATKGKKALLLMDVVILVFVFYVNPMLDAINKEYYFPTLTTIFPHLQLFSHPCILLQKLFWKARAKARELLKFQLDAFREKLVQGKLLNLYLIPASLS